MIKDNLQGIQNSPKWIVLEEEHPKLLTKLLFK